MGAGVFASALTVSSVQLVYLHLALAVGTSHFLTKNTSHLAGFG